MKYDIGLDEALSRTLERLTPLPPIDVEIEKAVGLAVAENCAAIVDCPSASVSMKDGYAVISQDLESASRNCPVTLKVTGSVFAGSQTGKSVVSETAVKVMTGAQIPQGADAVISIEFTKKMDDDILCYRDAGCGRNILKKGHDVKKGDYITSIGEILMPATTGLLAAGGISSVRVHPLPRIGIIAIGDEIVKPGESLKEGQLYASNIVTLVSWLKHFSLTSKIAIVPDQKELLWEIVNNMLGDIDVLITSGGAWKSERDLTVKTFQEMGGEIVFHHVKMGPGKAVAVILLKGRAVFCLPGGPPSNEMAFLQIALPSLFHLSGKSSTPFKNKTAVFANALIKIPEGVERLEKGEEIQIQVLFDRIH
jgi:molybdopterin molybdotransferase